MRLPVRILPRLFAAAMSIVGLVSVAPAGTTGSLNGKVTDIQTGEALPQVNILVTGSGRGGVTNSKGEYSISGITAGVYTVRISLLGYQAMESRKVTINADETAVLNFKLASSDIELEGITVEGRPPIVDVSKTAGDQTFSRDKIEALPDVKGVEDVLALQAGVVRFGGQLFLRGGRANETQILIDGVAVNDGSGAAAVNQDLQQIYAGNASGGVLSVSAAAIQSVSVESGGLDGEFGNAQSGVINVTTKSGTESYSGAVEYRTDALTSQDFNSQYYSLSLGGPEPLTSSVLPLLGLRIPGRMTFFLSSSFDVQDGPYSFNTSQFYSPIKRTVSLGPLSFSYTDRQSNSYIFNAKLTYYPDEASRLMVSYRANTTSAHPLSGGFAFKNLSDSSYAWSGINEQAVLQWSYLFSSVTELQAHASYLSSDSRSGVGNLDPPQYTPYVGDPNSDGYVDYGTYQSWNHSVSETWNFKVKFESQLHPLHRLKTGIDYYAEGIRSTDIYAPTDPDREINPAARGEFPEYGFARWVLNNYPSRGALWAQDNISFGTLNIVLILRYDFMYLGKQVFDPEWVGRWESLTQQPATWLGRESFWSQFTQGYFSPRFRVGYPISTETVFYFNYNTYLQFPDRVAYFYDPVSTSLGNRVGNPSLKPQKTISYEAGFDQAIFTDLSLGIRGFYKDVFDLASERTLPVSPSVVIPVNLDYASTRGFEVIINKMVSNHWFGNVNFTFQLAKGRSPDPRASDEGAFKGLPREVRMPWDQNITSATFIGYMVGPNEDYRVFGMLLNNWSVSLSWNYGSGFPYTPYSRQQNINELYLVNTGDGPYTSRVDVSLSKGFRLVGGLGIGVNLSVRNLLDRRNVNLTAGGFNTLTGRVTEYGDYNPSDNTLYPWVAGGTAFDVRVPPYVFDPPRQVVLGVKLTWD